MLMNYEDYVSDRVKAIKFSPIRKFSNLVSSVEGAISLTIGQPDFNTPENIKNAGILAIRNNNTTYTSNQGYAELRKEISKYLKNRFSLSYDYESEIAVTVGAGEAIDAAIRTMVNTGDEVLIPSPGYIAYESCTRLSGGIPVFVPTYIEDGFKLKTDMLKKYINPGTKLLILSYPSNPTGATMDEKDLEEISRLVIENDMFVISDEIYSELIYNGNRISIASLDGMKERTIIINGFSKTYSMTGWRLGYVAAPAALMKHLIKVHQYNVTCASSISQAAGIEALKGGSTSVEAMVKEYDNRRKYCFNRLQDMGLKCFEPSGAFYIFPEIKNFGLSSEEFCTRLLYEDKLAVVPGSAFGIYGEGYIRISYAYSMDVLKEGMNRLEKFVQSNI